LIRLHPIPARQETDPSSFHFRLRIASPRQVDATRNYGFGMSVSEHFRQTMQKVFEHGGGINGFAASMK